MNINITRTTGVFDIVFNTKKKDFAAKLDYNIMGFLCSALIPVIDRLKETNQYKLSLKKACNDVLKEAEKCNLIHFKSYQEFGVVEQDGQKIHTADIYNTTAKAYDYMLELMVTRKPSEIVSIVQILKEAEEKGLDLAQVTAYYTAVKL